MSDLLRMSPIDLEGYANESFDNGALAIIDTMLKHLDELESLVDVEAYLRVMRERIVSD